MNSTKDFLYALGQAHDERAERLVAVQRLVQQRSPDRESLAEALMAWRGVAEELALAKFLADESIPLEERRRFGKPLSEEEIEALEDGGLKLNSDISLNSEPIRQGYWFLADVLLSCLTAGEAAKRLSIPTATFKKLAAQGEVYSVEEEFGLLLFPTFQFIEHGLLPGFHVVAPSIPREISVAGVVSWFLLENPDLFVDDDVDQILSPVDWLRTRYDPAEVVRLVRRL